MDWYALFKFLHVSAAIIWIGAGSAMVFLGVVAERARDSDKFMHVIHQVIFLSPRVFMPASIAAVVFGLVTAYLGGWNTLWVWLGLAGFAATAGTGNFLLHPLGDRLGALLDKEGYSDRAKVLGDEVLSIAQFDYILLFVVVADMIFKPSFGDWPLLLVFVLVLAAAAMLFLRRALRLVMAAQPSAMPTR